MSQILRTIVVIGIDLGKNSFHVVGLDEDGAPVLRQKWSRGQVEARLANMPHVRKRACASLISDVYIQEGTRMLAVSRCWVSDHAAIASKSQDTKAAALDEVAGAGARPDHPMTGPQPGRNSALPRALT